MATVRKGGSSKPPKPALAVLETKGVYILGLKYCIPVTASDYTITAALHVCMYTYSFLHHPYIIIMRKVYIGIKVH